ncbi:MAG: hypothetical protein KF760_30355 [Candidatus Eremiobacteraeota bacterium]|nr:hypothetical protein [Candidatus Eremiobacteraeota bacterium]MCW5868117.1 hypothetical protein [Candidatus Eremiobacteraeota bacterium]
MRVQNTPQFHQPKALKKNDGGDSPKPPEEPKQQNAIMEFWEQYETPVNIGGGALIGAGLAKWCGLPSEAVMSAAGSGALAGFFAGSPKKAALMAGGAAVGAGIATLAGLPGAGVMGAAGTGTLVAWLFG